MTDIAHADSQPAPPALILETRAEQLLASCQRVPEVIDNPEDAKGATDMVKYLRRVREAIDDQRLEYTRPLDEVKAMLIGKAKILTEPLQHWEGLVGDRLTAYQIEEERKADEAEAAAKKKAEEAAFAEAAKLEEEGKPEEAQDALDLAADVPAPAPPDSGRVHAASGAGASLQVKWVPDFANADIKKIPLEYLMIDERKVRSHVALETRGLKSGQAPGFEIPGIPIIKQQKSRVS